MRNPRPIGRHVAIGILAWGLAGPTGSAAEQPLDIRTLCGPGPDYIGHNWVPIPGHSDLRTAEEICLAVPGALRVIANGPERYTGAFTRVYDCVSGTCTSNMTIPEPGCSGSCFCLDPGEGVEIVPSAATEMPINGCDTFSRIYVPPETRHQIISIPFDTFVTNANEFFVHAGYPTTGIQRPQMTRLDCVTGEVITCTAGGACAGFPLTPGEAYVVTFFYVSPEYNFTNPVACSPTAPPAADSCPIGDLGFLSQTAVGWSPPAACPLPLLYDAIRGDLSCLRGFCTQSITPVRRPCAGCLSLEENDGDTMAADLEDPAVGEGYWYEVRVDGGTWNAPAAPRHCADLDAMLGEGCP